MHSCPALGFARAALVFLVRLTSKLFDDRQGPSSQEGALMTGRSLMAGRGPHHRQGPSRQTGALITDTGPDHRQGP